MATTTNYGWSTPDDTSLVKDGAAAIRTLGSSVDTTTKALNPSTTLGDLEYRSATSNTNTRLGIGSTGNILTVAGGVPTWAAPAGTTPPFVGCMLFIAASQTISSGTATVVSFPATDYIDTDAFHDTTTNNSRITIPAGKAGKYLVFGQGFFADFGTSPARADVYLRLNGAQFSTNSSDKTPSRTALYEQSIMTLAVGDYVEFQVLHYGGGNTDIWGTSALSPARGTRFGVQYLGA